MGNKINSIDEDDNIDINEYKKYIGENSEYYLNIWSKQKYPEKMISWNFSSFIFGLFWFGYRRMYLEVFCFCLLFITFGAIQINYGVNILGIFWLIVHVIMGLSGNMIYYSYIEREIKRSKISSEIKIKNGTSIFGIVFSFILYALFILLYYFLSL